VFCAFLKFCEMFMSFMLFLSFNFKVDNFYSIKSSFRFFSILIVLAYIILKKKQFSL
jgi:hypothetical protein